MKIRLYNRSAKRAIVIAIQNGNQPDQNFALDTPFEVAGGMVDVLEGLGCDVILMRDDYASKDDLYPTAENIARELGRLVEGATSDHRLVVYYAGHGTLASSQQAILTATPDPVNQRTPDGSNACMEVAEPPHILGKQMKEILCRSLPDGCQVTVIYDCCHSSNMLGLEFVYTTNDIRASARPLQHMIIETPTEASATVEPISDMQSALPPGRKDEDSMEEGVCTEFDESVCIVSISANSVEGSSSDRITIGHALSLTFTATGRCLGVI